MCRIKKHHGLFHSLYVFSASGFQVNLTGRMLTGSSIRKVLVREAKSCAAVAVVVGISQPNALG